MLHCIFEKGLQKLQFAHARADVFVVEVEVGGCIICSRLRKYGIKSVYMASLQAFISDRHIF